MSASWVHEPWLCIDTETTGIDPFADRVVQVAAVMLAPDGGIGAHYETIVDPGVDIPDEAAAVHGITTDRARTEGVTTAEAIAEVGRRIFSHGHRPVVMFNAGFDWPILLAEAERHGVEFPFLAPVLDPYLIDRMLDQYRRGSRKLVAVADHYDVELDEADAHGALADAVAAGRVMRAIVARYPQVGERSLASVFLRQVRGYERWREGFVDYVRRQRDPQFDQPPGWPIPAIVRGGLPVVDPADSSSKEAASESPATAADPGSGESGDREAPAGRGSGVRSPDPAPAPDVHAPASEAPTSETPADGVVPTAGASTPVTPRSYAARARHVFADAYERAPRGDKTRLLERLRHAVIYCATAAQHTSATTAEARQLLVAMAMLDDIADGNLVYDLDDHGVTFRYPNLPSARDVTVTWTALDRTGAAA